MVLLDRDGVLNFDSADYVRTLADWRPVPGSAEAVARLSHAGCRVVVVTNQSGVGRGLIRPEDLDALHRRLAEDVAACGGRIEAILHCPHRPEDGCDCRKPRTGLVRAAERRLGTRARGALFVGDRVSDVETALAVGARPVLVETGRPLPPGDDPIWRSVTRARDLAEVVDRFLAERVQGRVARPVPARRRRHRSEDYDGRDRRWPRPAAGRRAPAGWLPDPTAGEKDEVDR